MLHNDALGLLTPLDFHIYEKSIGATPEERVRLGVTRVRTRLRKIRRREEIKEMDLV